jgi:putative ABC transport system substrate-binding protein
MTREHNPSSRSLQNRRQGHRSRAFRSSVLTRRASIALLAGLATGLPRPTLGQAAGPQRRVAWLGMGRQNEPSVYVDSLRAGLRELGWIEDQNFSLKLFWATGRDNMEAAIRDLFASNPEVIVTQEFMTMAMQATKTTIPVVFGFSGDPRDVKLVESFARPGTNMTGMTYLALDLVGKRVELLTEWLPNIKRFATLARPQHPGAELERQATEAAVKKLGLEQVFFPYTAPSLPARDLGELEKTFRAIEQAKCDALIVFPDTAMAEISEPVGRFALNVRLPSVTGWAPLARNGLLMSYGPNVADLYRSLGRYVDRILRGANPAELPVEVPTTFQLVINLKTAKTLGLNVPQSFQARADEVIE